jgi:hypothetical protein
VSRRYRFPVGLALVLWLIIGYRHYTGIAEAPEAAGFNAWLVVSCGVCAAAGLITLAHEWLERQEDTPHGR